MLPEACTPFSLLCSPASSFPLGRISLTSPSSPAAPGPAHLGHPTPRTAETGTAVTPVGSVASALAGRSSPPLPSRWCCLRVGTREGKEEGRIWTGEGPASRCQPCRSASGTQGACGLQKRTQSKAGPQKDSPGLVPRPAWDPEACLRSCSVFHADVFTSAFTSASQIGPLSLVSFPRSRARGSRI